MEKTNENKNRQPISERHLSLSYDGQLLSVDNLPASVTLPSALESGLRAIFSVLEGILHDLTGICVRGIYTPDAHLPFCAFDLWVQAGDEGFFLAMDSAAALFRDHGIPCFRRPQN